MKKIINTFFTGRFIKFCIIGFINTAIHLIIYNVVLRSYYHVVLANTIAYILASTFSYFANTKFTYNKTPQTMTFVLVMLTFFVKLLLNAGLSYGFEKLILIIDFQVELLVKVIPIFVTIVLLPLQFLVFNIIFKSKSGEICEENKE